jgi:hypothetical protein
MAIGWEDIQRIKRIEAKVTELGFIFAEGNYTSGYENNNNICLKPKVDGLPHYSRNAVIFTGTLEEIALWVQGIEWARQYDEMLKISNSKKREEREQVERNKQLLKTIKTGKLADGTVGSMDIDDVEEQYDDNIPF